MVRDIVVGLPVRMGFKGSEVQILSPRPKTAKEKAGKPFGFPAFFVGFGASAP